MPKRKGITNFRIEMMKEGKKLRREQMKKIVDIVEVEKLKPFEELSESLCELNECAVPPVVAEVMVLHQIVAKQDLDENFEGEFDEDFDDENDEDNLTNYNVNSEQSADGNAPDYIYIDGIPIPTKFLVDPRNGDGLVLEVENEFDPPYLAEFNGNYHDLWQVSGAVWSTTAGIEKQITVGITTRNVHSWARNANGLGQIFVKKPTRRTTACRSVITAIQDGLIMEIDKAFSFKLYVRTKLLAEKVKGLVRKITKSIHKGEAVDDLGELEPFYRYIEQKLLNAIEHLPPFNQNAVIEYQLRRSSDSVGLGFSTATDNQRNFDRDGVAQSFRREFFYALSLMRSHSSEHRDSLPVLDVTALRHIAYVLDGIIFYMRAGKENEVDKSDINIWADLDENENDDGEDEPLDGDDLSDSAMYMLGSQQGRRHSFFQRSESTLCLGCPPPDPFNTPMCESLPLADQPHLVQPNARRADLFSIPKQAITIASNGSEPPGVNSPLELPPTMLGLSPHRNITQNYESSTPTSLAAASNATDFESERIKGFNEPLKLMNSLLFPHLKTIYERS